MTPTMKMTKQEAARIGDIARAAVAEAMKTEGYEMKPLGGTFDEGGLNFRCRLQKKGGMTREALRYKELAPLMGLPPLGTGFQTHHGYFEISGLTRGDRVIAKGKQNGKDYAFTVSAILQNTTKGAR